MEVAQISGVSLTEVQAVLVDDWKRQYPRWVQFCTTFLPKNEMSVELVLKTYNNLKLTCPSIKYNTLLMMFDVLNSA